MVKQSLLQQSNQDKLKQSQISAPFWHHFGSDDGDADDGRDDDGDDDDNDDGDCDGDDDGAIKIIFKTPILSI